MIGFGWGVYGVMNEEVFIIVFVGGIFFLGVFNFVIIRWVVKIVGLFRSGKIMIKMKFCAS